MNFPFFLQGSIHLFNLVKYSREVLEGTDLKTVQNSILNNNWFAHCECILIAMLADEDQSKRELAVKHIRRARENYRPVIREVNKPKRGEMNFNASQYCDMIDLDATEVTESPCTFQLSDEELESIVAGQTKFRLPKVYCHTQSCERAVSQTTLASQKVVSTIILSTSCVHEI